MLLFPVILHLSLFSETVEVLKGHDATPPNLQAPGVKVPRPETSGA